MRLFTRCSSCCYNYNDVFSYDEINIEESIKFHEYQSMTRYNDDFISFAKRQTTKDNPYLRRQAGWKFHISIDDSDHDNMANAWNLILGIIIRYQLNTAKVLRQGIIMHEKTPEQRGKQIVIYAFHNPDKNWQTILNEIELTLTQHYVKTSYKPQGDKAVTGSNYISYRNDAIDKDGLIAPSRHTATITHYNPHGFEDVFANISITVPNSIIRPTKPRWFTEDALQSMFIPPNSTRSTVNSPDSSEKDTDLGVGVDIDSIPMQSLEK